MIIQILLVPALVAAVFLSLRSRASLKGQARRKLLAGVTVVAGIVAVLFPDSLQELADVVGVTRGTDLLLYGLALVIIYLVGSTSARFREQETRLVLLARQVALNEAVLRHVEAARADGAPVLPNVPAVPSAPTAAVEAVEAAQAQRARRTTAQ